MPQPRVTVTLPVEVHRLVTEVSRSLGLASLSEVVAECVRLSALGVWRDRYPQRATDLGLPHVPIDQAERNFRERLNLPPSFWDPKAGPR